MSTVTIIIGITLTVSFGLLAYLCLQYHRDLQVLLREGIDTDSTATECKFIQNQSGDAQIVTVQYTANGQEYSHLFRSRPEQYSVGEHIALRIHPKKPKLVSVNDAPIQPNQCKLLALAVLIFYLAGMLFLISSEIPLLHTILKEAREPLEILAVILLWRREYQLVKKSVSCKGTIVYTGIYRRTFRVIAEYQVDGRTYATREYRFSQKHPKRMYTVGETVDILHCRKNPSTGILADDTAREKKMRIAALIACTIFAAIWMILLIMQYSV